MLVICEVLTVPTTLLGSRRRLLAIHPNSETAVHAAEVIPGARME